MAPPRQAWAAATAAARSAPNGYVPGGGAFLTHRVSPDLALGFAVAGNFGSMLDYDDDWAGRYRVQDADLVGVSVMPSIAYRVNDKLSLGAGINGMYGMFDQRVAIKQRSAVAGDGRLEIDDDTWGWGANVGVLYEPMPGTRLGLTYTSEIDLDFVGQAQFSGIGPVLTALLQSRGLLDARVDIGAKVPQQVMGSVYTEIDDRWALLGNVGWQDWSEFGEVELGIDNTQDPVSLTNPLSFDDTWHVAVGAQYRKNEQWKVNVASPTTPASRTATTSRRCFRSIPRGDSASAAKSRPASHSSGDSRRRCSTAATWTSTSAARCPRRSAGAAIWWVRTTSRWPSC